MPPPAQPAAASCDQFLTRPSGVESGKSKVKEGDRHHPAMLRDHDHSPKHSPEHSGSRLSTFGFLLSSVARCMMLSSYLGRCRDACRAALVHDHHAIRKADDLLHLGSRPNDHGDALVGELTDELVDLAFAATTSIRAWARRGSECAGSARALAQRDLLLVSAGEETELLRQARGPDVERLDIPSRFASSACGP